MEANRSALYSSSSSNPDSDDTVGSTANTGGSSEPHSAITDEMERLQQQLTYIEALEERNKAQLDSFVDEQDQWDSMEEEERQLLRSKAGVEKRLEQMTSELVSMWMGGKSMEG
jgi:small-conductance mechanosensitive channel